MTQQSVTLQPLRLDPTCADCAYCKVDAGMLKIAKAQNLQAPDQGICVRFPPRSQIVGSPQGPMTIMVNDVVPMNHWCGEFKGKHASC